MPEPKLSFAVAILNWNGVHWLRQFLPAVIQHTPQARIYVIDNASTDESITVLQNEFPQLTLIQNTANTGYAGGYNTGLQSVTEDIIVLLNSDIEVTPGWLQPFITAFTEDPALGAAQPKIKDFNNKSHFEYAGAAGGFMDILGYPFCRGRIFDHLEEDNGQYDTPMEIFWATGACMVARKTAYQQAGGLNQVLFAHMEEIDLCWRMRNLNYSIKVLPQSVVYHVGGGTLNKISPQKTFLNFRNNLIIIMLNMPSASSFFIILTRLLLDGIAALKFLADGQPKHLVAVLKAHFSFYGLMPRLMLERNKKAKPLKNLPGVYKRSIVWDYFSMRKKEFSKLPVQDKSNI